MKRDPEPAGGMDPARLAEFREKLEVLQTEIRKVFIGQHQVVEEILIALLCRGHILLEGVPGLGKTLLIRTLGQVTNLSFSRVQFTPDLMPSDIIGTEVVEEDPETGKRGFRFVKGPVFAHLLLADEINRTPPKTQSALLEAMQECGVTVAGIRYPLPAPFFVLATQNPIEQEGTYPLPEAQLDRFMFKVLITYPTLEEEEDVVMRTTADDLAPVTKVLEAPALIEVQNLVRKVPVSRFVTRYAVTLVRNSRPGYPESPKFINEYVSWGGGPRASQYLILAGKARALIQNRFHVSVEDIGAMAAPVLRHRLVSSFAAEAENVPVEDLIRRLLEYTRVPEYA